MQLGLNRLPRTVCSSKRVKPLGTIIPDRCIERRRNMARSRVRRDAETVKKSTSIKLRDAAAQLDVHYMTAYRYVRTGALPAEQRNGHWYVDADELASFMAKRAETPRPVGRPPKATAATHHVVRSRRQAVALADRLMAGDQRGAWHLIEEALGAGVGIRQINARLLTPALQHIGDEWAAGRVSVGDEHRASVLAMRLVSLLGGRFNRPGRKRGTVLVSAVPGDRHGLPSAIMADLLRAEGFEVVDLGADTPIADIIAMAAAQDRLVGVGLCATSPLQRSTEREIREAVREIGAATGKPVLLGGSAVTEEISKRIEPDHHSSDADDAVSWFVDLVTLPAAGTAGLAP